MAVEKILKPPYVDPAGDTSVGVLPVRPPFQFSGVTSRVFPLRANMATLTQFVDAYCNMDIPPEVVHFRPALPYVYMMVLDYGSMSSASKSAQNVGWVSQHEVTFTVPLQRWRKVGDKLVFQDWAAVSPFIFVDDEISQRTGREVYGWPKVVGKVEAFTPMWDHHPLAGTRLFTFSTPTFPHVYAGETEQPMVLLQIDLDPAPRLSQFPPDPRNPWAPWNVYAQAARSSLSLMGQATDMALALRMRGFRTERANGSLKAMSAKASDYALRMGPALVRAQIGGMVKKLFGSAWPAEPVLAQGESAEHFAGSAVFFDNITVKQFRDAQEPKHACYKALVRSSMGIERLNGGGLLGDSNLLRGDSSGGYTVRIHRYTAQPIIESLGIEVSKDDKHTDGTHVSLLKPVFPFWSDVDLYYGEGHVICSRIYAKGVPGLDHWVDEQDAHAGHAAGMPRHSAAVEAAEESAAAQAALAAAATERQTASGDYNNALGAATQPMIGPFHFPDVTQHVYPLLAERDKLDAFIKSYLNDTMEGSGMRFETCGSYVYMMVNMIGSQNGTMWSSSNDLGWWAEREVSFSVPVRWYRQTAEGFDELVSIALVSPFVYASNGRAVNTDREVNGRPTWQARIDSPPDVWLDSSGPNRPRRHLTLSTEVFPALGFGQKAEDRTLIELDQGDVLPYNDYVGWRMVGEQWGVPLLQELTRKTELSETQKAELADARAMALEILAHGAPINWLVLKQYRDATDVTQACYQALIHTRRTIERIYDIREIEERMHVRMHRYPGHPIVQRLGLRVKSTDSSGGKVVENLQPLRPFWMRLSVREELSTTVAVRRPDGTWHAPHPWLAGEKNSYSARPGLTNRADLHEAPYFCGQGRTRVGTQWPLKPQRLRTGQEALLHDALQASLAAALEAIKPLEADELHKLRLELGEAQAAELDQLLAAPDLAAYAEARDSTTLLELERALMRVGVEFEATEPHDQRMTHAQASQSMGRLGELQLVIESVLSAEWENWGNPRWFQGLKPRPEPCIRADSLHGGLDALQGCAPGSQVLGELTEEGGWVFLKKPQ